MLEQGMARREAPVYLSVARVDAHAFTARHPQIHADLSQARILRSALMKPEAELYVERLHERVERLAGAPGPSSSQADADPQDVLR
ncbi:hypothetical protein ACIQNU_18055 [Streptomyces sp. NPDC091292]|uniref:hypothetical protein n=1 Tax=Streptomyces sp. NPDC091292 TaxID=3365991 RepID=UPI0037F76ED1